MSRARFIIRWDDISPYQDSKKYWSLIDLFTKYNIPAVLGVIPENHDDTIKFDAPDETKYVTHLQEIEKIGWEIAQHGYRHIKHNDNGGILGLNKASELAGRSFDDQLSDIESGKKVLNDYGFNPVTFIPPWHSYDKSTLTALEQADFKIISDGMFLYPRKEGKLLQLPQIFWSVPGRIRVLDQIGSVYTICLHPQLITDDDLEFLELFFREADAEVITASSLLEEGNKLTRKWLRRRSFEFIFRFLYRRNMK
jgi:predicted deacetylase